MKTSYKNNQLHFAETNIFNDFTTYVINDEKKQSRWPGWNKLLLRVLNTTILKNKLQIDGGSLMIYLTVSYFGQSFYRRSNVEWIHKATSTSFPKTFSLYSAKRNKKCLPMTAR